jgi:hypothetical protein
LTPLQILHAASTSANFDQRLFEIMQGSSTRPTPFAFVMCLVTPSLDAARSSCNVFA